MLAQVPNPEVLSRLVHGRAVRFSSDILQDDGVAAEGIVLPPALSRATGTRRAEFLAGRVAAARALRAAGCDPPLPVGIGADRAPEWPAGYVGSITHSHGFAFAAVASAGDLRSLGVDSELVVEERVAEEIRELVLTAGDLDLYREEPAALLDLPTFVTLAVSAKESVYKCLHPLTGGIVDFSDVALSAFDPSAGVFRLRIVNLLNREFRGGMEVPGRFCFRDGFVHTAVEAA